MKLLILTTTFPRWKDDGVPSFILDLSKGLHRLGLEIIVLAPYCVGSKKFEVLEGIRIYRYGYFYPARYQRLVDGNGILPNIKKNRLALIQLPLLFVSELYFAFRIINREKIDIIHSHWLVPNSLVGAICHKYLGVKHILTEHAAGLAALDKLPIRRRVLQYIYNNTDAMTTVSMFIKNNLEGRLQSAFKDRSDFGISIIPMGVEIGRHRKLEDKAVTKENKRVHSKNILLFIGRLVDKKGLGFLIDAMPTILRETPDTLLLVCGDGPLREIWESKARDLNISHKIQFLGRVSDREKQDFLSIADILIVPSIITAENDYEGLPVVILEGLASGLPVIASDIGGICDAIKDGYNGFLIEEKRIDLISEKVLDLLKNPQLWEVLSEHALESSKKYDWNAIAAKYFKKLTVK